MLIDTHAHLSFPDFKDEISEILQRAKAAEITKIINVSCDLKSSEAVLQMLSVDECLYATLGMHPYEANDVDEELMQKWEKIIEEDKVSGKPRIVGIGECGLDYFKAKTSRDVQMKAFKMQLDLAFKMDLPVIVHNREADQDTLTALLSMEKESGKKLRVVFHCFSSDLDFAQEVWANGYFTSFTGNVTYPNASNLREVVCEVPEDRFMVETDCPFLAPQKYRGQRNEPAYVAEVIKLIATEKGIPLLTADELSYENSVRFFNLSAGGDRKE